MTISVAEERIVRAAQRFLDSITFSLKVEESTCENVEVKREEEDFETIENSN